MSKVKKLVCQFVSFIFIFSLIFVNYIKVINAASIKAFPEVEGFGENTIGGRGGEIYEVTNLNDSGSGSLRDCVNDVNNYGPRICVFKVGGTITLTSSLSITKPYITIAGQTAPGGGITLKKTSGGDIFSPKTHDIIIRYITGRPGPGGENHAVQTAVNGGNSIYNIVFDHCSFSWGVDSVWETWYQVYNSTIQWSFVNEGLDCATPRHSKGCHSKGLMIGGFYQKYGDNFTSTGLGSYNISVLKNLMAHNGERTPLMQLCGIGQVINNVTYNPYWTFAHQQLNCIGSGYEGTSYVNWVNNYFKKGPDTESGATGLKIIPRDSDSDDPWGGVCSSGKAYVNGNVVENGTFTSGFSGSCSTKQSQIISSVPAEAPSVNTLSAQSAYTKVLDEGGNSRGIDCNGKWFSRRDTIDTRVVNDVKNGTGKIIDSPTEVGGWTNIENGNPCLDDDKDGMPNDWEKYFGLNPNDKSDTKKIAPSGYTWIEEYINGSSPLGNATSTTSPSPTVLFKLADANKDGLVNNTDFDIWRCNFLKSSQCTFTADFDKSGVVDGVDYVIWMLGQ